MKIFSWILSYFYLPLILAAPLELGQIHNGFIEPVECTKNPDIWSPRKTHPEIIATFFTTTFDSSSNQWLTLDKLGSVEVGLEKANSGLHIVRETNHPVRRCLARISFEPILNLDQNRTVSFLISRNVDRSVASKVLGFDFNGDVTIPTIEFINQLSARLSARQGRSGIRVLSPVDFSREKKPKNYASLREILGPSLEYLVARAFKGGLIFDENHTVLYLHDLHSHYAEIFHPPKLEQFLQSMAHYTYIFLASLFEEGISLDLLKAVLTATGRNIDGAANLLENFLEDGMAPFRSAETDYYSLIGSKESCTLYDTLKRTFRNVYIFKMHRQFGNSLLQPWSRGSISKYELKLEEFLASFEKNLEKIKIPFTKNSSTKVTLGEQIEASYRLNVEEFGDLVPIELKQSYEKNR